MTPFHALEFNFSADDCLRNAQAPSPLPRSPQPGPASVLGRAGAEGTGCSEGCWEEAA